MNVKDDTQKLPASALRWRFVYFFVMPIMLIALAMFGKGQGGTGGEWSLRMIRRHRWNDGLLSTKPFRLRRHPTINGGKFGVEQIVSDAQIDQHYAQHDCLVSLR